MPQAVDESTDARTGITTQTVIPWTADALKAEISRQRYEREIGGITVGSQFVSTERDEIGHWNERRRNADAWAAGDPAAIADNPSGVYPYKPKGGAPAILSLALTIRIHQCLKWYVNTCFAAEYQLYQMIDAGTDLETVAAALVTAWPQQQFDEVPA